MSEPTTEPPPGIETWTKEDVRHWLMTEVKVHETCADRFCDEEVSGDSLVNFEKKDILDLGIKHGPAVKIASYLERLKEGSQHESQFPAHVENRTKEEVTQWLLQHVKVHSKYAERLQEEDVSGDCLVCFRKQDFLDLEVKSGPAVKILKELGRLNNTESPLRPIFHSIRWSLRAKNRQENKKTNAPLEKTPGKGQLPMSQTKKKEADNPAPLIKNTLDRLRKADLKSFCFELENYANPVPRSKLEDKDTMDISTLVTDHYGCEEALCITRNILQKINQNKLASQLINHAGEVKRHHRCGADEKGTAKSDSLPCSRCEHEEREERNVSCFMNVKINLPSCLN
ncbi:uncharacterized protein LOC122877435 [Siniperca chuatsi]|uniref:uncharacterized protein LOC122877435 n=1 Tax=Siniperca chuatsi TaxID=119488 RepID=UPI001CE17A80|nr:uncharacterized protein LOC122877435 [Siniperca chuatsi]XP_044054923.1 uncharacterized protein LOC122877435 [Siniperca chuatsi]